MSSITLLSVPQSRTSFRAAVAAILVSGLIVGAPAPAAAQWKPQSAVEIVVPNTAGGGNDTVARIMSRILTDRKFLEVPGTVVNKPGGAGNVALAYLAQKPGDAGVLSIVSVTQQLNHIGGKSQFGARDFTPMATLIGDYVAFAVPADSPITSGKSMIERLRKDPTSLSSGVTGVGGNNHIALVLAMRSGGVDAKKLKTPVFQSSKDSITAMLGGHIDVHVGSVGPLKPLVESGKVRVLAVSSESRLEGAFANVPTWKEQGINGTFSTWRGLWAPKGLTAQQVAYWDGVLSKFANSEDWKRELEKREWVNDYRTSGDTQKYLAQLETELREVLKDLGLAKD